LSGGITCSEVALSSSAMEETGGNEMGLSFTSFGMPFSPTHTREKCFRKKCVCL
jgi:hypothetical protein